MKATKAMLETRIKALEQIIKERDVEIKGLRLALNFNPQFNFLTATMSTNKLARRMVELAMDFRRGCR